MAQLAALAARGLGAGAAGGGSAAAAGGAASAFEGLSTALSKVNPLVGQISNNIPDVFGKLKAGIAEINSQVVAFVAKLNPAFVNKWNLAVDDLFATVGRSLVPVLQQATSVVRSIGDAFASLDADGRDFVSLLLTGGGAFTMMGDVIKRVLPPLVSVFNSLGAAANALFGALEPLGNVLGDIVVGAFQAIADAIAHMTPRFEVVTELIWTLSAAFEAFYRVMKLGIDSVVKFSIGETAAWIDRVKVYLMAFNELFYEFVLEPLRELTGVDTGELRKSSVGASYRSTSVGDQQSFINKALTSAFAAGSGVKTEDQKRTDLAKQVAEKVEEIKTWVREASEKVMNTMDAIRMVISPSSVAGDGAGAAGKAVADSMQGRDMLRNLYGV